MIDKFTIGITSCNRLHYLRALLNSLKCVKEFFGEQCQIVIVDTGSSENGLQGYIKDLHNKKFVDSITLMDPMCRDWINDEYKAKNSIIDMSNSEQILFLQDDCQFIGCPESLQNTLKSASMSRALCVDVMGVRRKVLDDQISDTFKEFDGLKLWSTKNKHFQTTGIFDSKVFFECGQYPTGWTIDEKNWGRSEDEYNKIVRAILPDRELTMRTHVPLFVSIWNDPRGGYAFIRENKRFGVYSPPVDASGLYYSQYDIDEFLKMTKSLSPLTYIDVARPLGWTYSVDEHGEQVKYGQRNVMSEGPVEVLPGV